MRAASGGSYNKAVNSRNIRVHDEFRQQVDAGIGLHDHTVSDILKKISSKGIIDMGFRVLLAGVMTSSLIAAPAMANSASSLSVAKAANVKAVTSSKKSSKLLEGGPLIALLGGAAIVAGAIVIVADDNDSKPDSN